MSIRTSGMLWHYTVSGTVILNNCIEGTYHCITRVHRHVQLQTRWWAAWRSVNSG